MSHEQSADPVEHASPVDFAATLARLLKAIEQSGMTLFTTIDRAAGARDAGLTMPPTLVLIYGNPKGGTPMMLEAPLVALDLPLRVLLRQDADGRASVSFHPIEPLLRHAVVPDALANRLNPAQRVLVEALDR